MLSITNGIEKLEERNKAYYAKFPEDAERVKNIVKYLDENRVALPSGWLTTSRFLELGIMLGFHGTQSIIIQDNDESRELKLILGRRY